MDLNLELVTNPDLLLSCLRQSPVTYLVLEVGFNQESSHSDDLSEPLQEVIELDLFLSVEHILRVEDGWSVEGLDLLQRVLLEVLLCEDLLNLFVKQLVVYLGWVLS